MVRVRSGGRGVPAPGDVILAAVLALVSVGVAAAVDPVASVAGLPLIPGREAADSPLSLTLVALACAPVALRRHRPYGMLVLNQAPIIALAAIDADPGTAGLATLVLLHAVAAYRGLALSMIAVATAGLGYVITALISTTAWLLHLLACALIFAAWMVGRTTRLRRAYLAELEDRAERLERAREADRRAARAEERSRIARELHDVVAHHVSVMTVQAAAARKVLATKPELAADALSAIEEMGRTAMAEMRSIVGVLRTDGDEDRGERAPQPGVDDLPGLVEQMREAGLRAQLWIEGERPRLPPGVDLAVYRLVQEALTNTLRHAGPSARAWVTLRHEPGELTVRVEDDGSGPAPEPRPAERVNGDRHGERHGDRDRDGDAERTGHGLVGIRERVSLYGGVLRIGPRQGGGFEVCARFPLTTDPPGER
jgi:Signal transduction histidine kinase